MEKERTLIIADLHLGIEHELFKSGITIPPQAKKFSELINKLISSTKARALIILGDIKHEVPGISYRELKEIPRFFSYLDREVDIAVTLGNHDSYLRELLPESVRVFSSRGFRIGRYGFFHGHAWPSEKLLACDQLFMGHLHPTIEFKDSFGFRLSEQVWIETKLNKESIKRRYKIERVGRLSLTALPSFNRLLGGLVLNRPRQKERFGPLLKGEILNLDEAKIHLLDGTYLGRLRMIKSYEKSRS